MPLTSARSGRAASSISIEHPAEAAISFSAEASPPRVASLAARVPGAAASTASTRCAKAGAIGSDVRRQRHVAARDQDRGTVIAEDTVDDGDIARADRCRGHVPARGDHTDPGCCDKNRVSGPAFHDLRVAGHDSDAGRVGLGPHRRHDAPKQIDLAAFLDDEGRRQPQRARAANREIVDRAADRESCRYRRRGIPPDRPRSCRW